MESAINNNKRTDIFFWTALISSWLTFIFFFTIPFGFLYWLVVLIILVYRKSNYKWYLLCFSAWTIIPLFSFFSGAKDYFSGEGTLKNIGMPSAEFYNLDKEYRVYNSTSGCIVLGIEFLTQTPNNWAVQLCTKVWGYQKGVHSGFYPDKKLAEHIVDSIGIVTSFIQSENLISFIFSDTNYQLLDEGYRGSINIDSCTKANVAIVDEVLIFKPIISGEENVVYLAERKNGNIFARYYE